MARQNRSPHENLNLDDRWQVFEQNQWLRLSIVLLLALIVRVALATDVSASDKPLRVAQATSPAKTKRAVRSSASTSASASRETVSTASSSFPIDLTAGPGLSFFDGHTGFSINVGATTPVSNKLPIHVGLDFGMSFWSENFFSIKGINLLGTGIYRFDLAKAPTIHPYVGLSFGPTIMSYSSDNFFFRFVSSSRVVLALLARPGVGFDLSKTVALNVETKLGILDGAFLFSPVVLASFAL